MVSVKSFLTFCTQPNRNFVPFLCITGRGFHIVLSDHVGHIKTNVIPFSCSTGTLIFLRMVMGLAFLSDNLIGLDGTMTCQEHGQSSGKQFYDEFPPFVYNMVDNPHIQLFTSPSISAITIDSPGTSAVHNDSVQDSNEHITSISIGSINYPVI